jgi:hypothetical protein
LVITDESAERFPEHHYIAHLTAKAYDTPMVDMVEAVRAALADIYNKARKRDGGGGRDGRLERDGGGGAGASAYGRRRDGTVGSGKHGVRRVG